MSSFCIGAIACDRFRFIVQAHLRQMTANQVRKTDIINYNQSSIDKSNKFRKQSLSLTLLTRSDIFTSSFWEDFLANSSLEGRKKREEKWRSSAETFLIYLFPITQVCPPSFSFFFLTKEKRRKEKWRGGTGPLCTPPMGVPSRNFESTSNSIAYLLLYAMHVFDYFFAHRLFMPTLLNGAASQCREEEKSFHNK